MGFVLEDLVGHGGGFVEGDVGWVRDDDIERCEGLEQGRGEEVGLEKSDAVGKAKTGGVVLGDRQSRGVEVGGGDAGGGKVGGEREGDGASAGADIEYVGGAVGGAGGGLGCNPMEDGLDEELGFGARDEGVAGDMEVEAVKLLLVGEVLDGLFGSPASDESAVGDVEVGGELGVGVGDEPSAVAEEDVGEERLGLAAIDGSGGFGEGFAKSHRAVLRRE